MIRGAHTLDPAVAGMVEEHQMRWFRYQAGAPGVEVHDDGDAVWITTPGRAWSNAIIGLRLADDEADARLDRILGRYRSLGRPAGAWIGPFAQPADIERRLRARGLHCRKRFPGMHLRTRAAPPPGDLPAVSVAQVRDFSLFRGDHPAIGRITTPLRRHALARTVAICTRTPPRAFQLVATLDGRPAGACIVFLDEQGVAGLQDMGVIEALRRRGIGGLLTGHAIAFARDRGYEDMVLIASVEGEPVYRRAGFAEVCRLAYFYGRLGRDG